MANVKKEWSIVQIQDSFLDDESRKRENLYASDSGKCPSGIYYSLLGYDKTSPTDPEGLRRMEVGNLVEQAQVKKLQKLGILIEPFTGDFQHRIYNEKYKVSGRIDALIVSPDHCTKETKAWIKEKIKVNDRLDVLKENFYLGLKKFNSGEIKEEDFIKGKLKLSEEEHELYKKRKELNWKIYSEKKNHFMIVEIKSISEIGFRWIKDTGKPKEDHYDQALFYHSELSGELPNLKTRVLYVQLPYQNLLEFDVPFDENRLKELQKFWTMINKAVEKKKPPEPAEDLEKSTSGKYKLSFKADICQYHIHCTGDPAWKDKALKKVASLNVKPKKK